MIMPESDLIIDPPPEVCQPEKGLSSSDKTPGGSLIFNPSLRAASQEVYGTTCDAAVHHLSTHGG